MKKLLSVILAILTIVSLTTVSFAAECDHVFDASSADRAAATFVCSSCGETVEYEIADYNEINTLLAYDPYYNLYTTDEYTQTAYDEFEILFIGLIEELPQRMSTYEQATVDEYAKKIENAFLGFSADVSEGKYGPATDAARLLLVMKRYDNFLLEHEPLDAYFSDETLHKIKVIQKEEFYSLSVMYNELSLDCAAITAEDQAEFERRLEIAEDMVDSMYNCTAGVHDYGEDLVCDFCGAIKEPDICEHCDREHVSEFDDVICIFIRIVKWFLGFIADFVK